MLSIRSLLLITVQILLLLPNTYAFAPRSSSTQQSSLHFTNEKADRSVAKQHKVTAAKQIKTTTFINNKKATVVSLKSLDDLTRFLEEDDRLVAIK
jgi:hypothetical protein